MGTPRKYFTVCGIETCSSVEALLDTGADDSAIAGVRKRCRSIAVERDHRYVYRSEIPVVYANHSKIT